MWLTAAVGTTNVVGYWGGSVSVKCEYDTQYSNRPKYFCQSQQGNCNQKIQTNIKNKWVTNGRYSLFDNGTHYFVVEISGLAPSDAGSYMCGVTVRGGQLVQTEIDLEVKNGKMSSLLSAVTLGVPFLLAITGYSRLTHNGRVQILKGLCVCQHYGKGK